MLKVRDLRESYIKYFVERGHRHIHSSPLIPKDDPTLLFTTAGMVQFKPMFAGTVKLDYTRAATVQKCLRTSDLENVGRTKRHCTFFEMLGNFSFGDYFKKEAIEWAWDYSVNVLGFQKEKLWVSIYQDDDEAFGFWNKNVGVPTERIVRLGKKDNFWGPAGDSGACGPCSELYIDKGPEFGCGEKDCKPGCDCERYMEYWNLVFNQFFQDTTGKQTPLPKTGIDTGMGLERLATIVQGVGSIYETDELNSLVQFVCKSLGIKYEGKNIVPVNVIVEHSRALTFAMSDGAYPSNEGRGYVLRRILRRALRFSHQLGVKDLFVYKMIDPVVEIMGDFYPEIVSSAKNVKNVIMAEEERFLETVEKGLGILHEVISDMKSKSKKEISGRDAFLLYDTYGFPVEMSEEIARENSLSINMTEFADEMKKQKERGKSSWKGADTAFEQAMNDLSKKCGATEFTGYADYSADAKITAISDGKSSINEISAGFEGFIVLEKTPFYGESGGQVGDSGVILAGDAVFRVSDTRKINKTIVHHGSLEKGSMKSGDVVVAEIDRVRRNLVKANHTVTHLLQAALRQILGTHVKQSGSLVEPDRMRFDFSHFAAMTSEQISEVEALVNRKIWEDVAVTTKEMGLKDALALGAMAEFGEKYEENVRVVCAGNFSTELCGGTHVERTGLIGIFKIIKESSPGAGTRRIEGMTLKSVYDRFNAMDSLLGELFSELDVPEKDIVSKVKDLKEKNNELQKQSDKMKSDRLASGVDEIMKNAVEHNGIKIVSASLPEMSIDDMRSLADLVRSKDQKSVVVFGAPSNGKAMLLCAATKPAVEKGVDAGAVIKEISKIVGGGGGGKKDMAQAGGKDTGKIKDAVSKGIDLLRVMTK